jgi:hypothetical protein
MVLAKSTFILFTAFTLVQIDGNPPDKEVQSKIYKTLVQAWPFLPFQRRPMHYRVYRMGKQQLVTIFVDRQPRGIVFSSPPDSPLLRYEHSIQLKDLGSELVFNEITYQLTNSWSGQSPSLD